MSDDIIPREQPEFDAEKGRAAAINSLPQNMRRLPAFVNLKELDLTEPKDKRNDPIIGTTDNSNTHFAMLAIWAARKHGIPVEPSLVLLVNRYRTSQGSDGTWGYDYARNGGGGSPALTCVALLGLAIGHVVDPDLEVKPEQDPRIVNAFSWLSKRIGTPAGTTVGRPDPKSAGGVYYFWAMERIAVLYDVRNLDKKDWYQWGAEILLGHQNTDGSWENAGQHVDHPALSTSLALLFLKRANLTPDLSRRLVVDPSALTQKVSDKVSPKPPPVTAPKVDTPAPAPMPKDVAPSEPEPEPQPQPTYTAAPQQQPPANREVAADEETSPKWPWILLLVVLVAIFAVCVFLIVRKMRNAEEAEEEKPKKKKKKIKPRAVE
jgi:hypothetical protein